MTTEQSRAWYLSQAQHFASIALLHSHNLRPFPHQKRFTAEQRAFLAARFAREAARYGVRALGA
jgi:hypothetical protein